MTTGNPQVLHDPDRLVALRRTALLDSPAEEAFDRLTRLAARFLGAPLALVNLIDDHRQYSKSCVAPASWPPGQEAPLVDSFCKHTVVTGEPLLVEDAREHPLVDSSSFVSQLGVVSYAGAPLITAEGHALGALCVADFVPRRWTPEETQVLADLAGAVVAEIQLRLDLNSQREVGAALRQSEQRFRAVMESAPIGMGVVGLDGRWIQVNRALCEMVGRPEAELVACPFDHIFHPHDRLSDAGHIARLSFGEVRSYEVEKRCVRSDGSTFWVLLTRSLVRDDAALPLHFVVQIQDISERRRGEEMLRERERRFRSLIENALDMVTVLDADGTILYESPSVERVLGYDPEQLIGRGVSGFVHPDDLPAVDEALRQLLEDPAGVYSIEVRFRHRDGSWRVLEARGSNRRADPAVGGIVINSRDVTERKEAEEKLARYAAELQELSLRDALTGLLNRRGYAVVAEKRLRLARRMNLHAVVVMADLDDMKPINDHLGHAAGDQALIETARILEETFRDSDIIARMGGDEFAVLAMVKAPAEAEALRLRLEEHLSARNRRGDRDYALSVSVGLAGAAPELSCTLEDLLARADAEMYRVKRDRKRAASRAETRPS